MTDLSKIDTTFKIGSWAIHQPVTTITGALIGVFCIYYFIQLQKTISFSKSILSWNLFFLYLGVASFFGACSHAFFEIHEGLGYKFFWLTGQLFDGFCIYAAQQATLYSVLRFSENKAIWRISYKVQLVLYTVSIFVFQNFLVAVIGFAVGLIPVMILHFKNGKNKTADLWIAYGILISFLTAFIHVFKIGLHAYFNHLDVAHVLALVNISVMYVGIKQKAESSILV